MIVFVGGMQRSGSTFSFNIAREILQSRGEVYQESSINIGQVVERAGRANHIIIKGHCLDPFGISLIRHGCIKTICTVRKPEVAITSLMNTFDFSLSESTSQIVTWFEMYRHIHPFVLTLDYHSIEHQPNQTAERIAEYLVSDASPDEATIISNRYQKKSIQQRFQSLANDGPCIEDIGHSYYDKETFLHRRHVSSLESERSVDKTLSEQDIVLVRNQLSRFIDDTGLVDYGKISALPRSDIPWPEPASLPSSLWARVKAIRR